MAIGANGWAMTAIARMSSLRIPFKTNTYRCNVLTSYVARQISKTYRRNLFVSEGFIRRGVLERCNIYKFSRSLSCSLSAQFGIVQGWVTDMSFFGKATLPELCHGSDETGSPSDKIEIAEYCLSSSIKIDHCSITLENIDQVTKN